MFLNIVGGKFIFVCSYTDIIFISIHFDVRLCAVMNADI